MIEFENCSKTYVIISSDSCLTGCCGFWNDCYFHTEFPETILEQGLHIGDLEIISIMVCLKLWGRYLKYLRIVVLVIVKVCARLFTPGNPGLRYCKILLEKFVLAATHEFELKAQHLHSEDNGIADILSRWHLDASYGSNFKDLTEGYNLKEFRLTEDLFSIGK